MNEKGKNNTLISHYLLVVFIIICSIFRYKTIYIDPNNTLQASLSSLLYPFTFLFIALILKNSNFRETHKMIIRTSIIFLVFILISSILNTIPGNYYATETDVALKQVLTPNYFIIRDKLIYYPNLINIISFTLIYYFSHTLFLILYEALEKYTSNFITFSLSMFITFTLDIICFVTINDIADSIEFNKFIIDLTTNFVIVIVSTITISFIYSLIIKSKN